ncbi:hypothetical protein LJE71_11190 [Xanthobacter autotrophicus]|uniref:hypothetical protein n=1 Tax=Xanthobacter autotrophicus TaxID=280 RepID=UPI001E493544|nr:hypothetical protein [Xanthobacter autotrophicus]UDQ91517.1 hypothetical protein LJE71_11190 [Xanthobacter autotrophicus]
MTPISRGLWPPFDPKSKGATGNLFDFYDPANPDLFARWDEVGRWFEARGEVGLDPYQRVVSTSTGPRAAGMLRTGLPFAGINLASQDYLSLSTHPDIVAAACEAALAMGVHSAGSAALMGKAPQMTRHSHSEAVGGLPTHKMGKLVIGHRAVPPCCTKDGLRERAGRLLPVKSGT